MAEFYMVEPKYDFKHSDRKMQFVEHDINTLIYDEAELMVDVNEGVTDDEYEKMVKEKAKEIKEKLIKTGSWRNEFGQLIFLYF